jgi:hypothetical protein
MLIAGERLALAGWVGAALITAAALIETRGSPRPDAERKPA